MSEAIAGPAEAATAPRASRVSSRPERLPAKALNREAMLQRTMLSASSGIRFVRSTRNPTGIVKTAPTNSETELRSPRSVLLMWSADSNCGAMAPTVDESAPFSANTHANNVMTLARAGPPVRLTTSPRTTRAIARMTRQSTRVVARSGPLRSWSGTGPPRDRIVLRGVCDFVYRRQSHPGHPRLMHPGFCPQCGERVTPFAAGCALCGADLDPRRWQRPPSVSGGIASTVDSVAHGQGAHSR